jgi:three-Cys-motif partner protein
VSDPYAGREQTGAKHFILRHYLQALAFKVLTFSDLTYVDGFSGPWQTKTEDFSDSSFMIAIGVLRDAQQKIIERTGKRRVRCFFSEADPEAFAQLEAAVTPFHQPQHDFEIKTFQGRFEDAIDEIRAFVGPSFPLIFIDPTGWAGYPLDKVRPLFQRRKCEVLINFMYEFVNRFSYSDDPDIIESLNPILGGPGWRTRLDPGLPRGAAVEKLFRETLKLTGQFEYVISTRIDKATAERPHFFITYGTKSSEGLKAFRETEYAALRAHAKSRGKAKEKRREDQTNTGEMFPGLEGEVQEASIDDLVEEQKVRASADLLDFLRRRAPVQFNQVVTRLLQPYMLRETNVKDICVELARAGRIENTWGGGNRKPKDADIIGIKTNHENPT